MAKEKKLGTISKKNTNSPMAGQKSYDELNFTDNFLFCKIMEKRPELCRQLLEIILNVKIKKIVFSSREATMGITPGGKGIRLDVYVADDIGTVYNLEMQVAPRRNLPKRMRYYQGMIDLNLIEKGMDYSELSKSFVIFICIFDFFEKGLPVYTFTNRCSEMPELELGDDTVKVFVNPYGDLSGLTEDMRAFLKYLKGELTENNSFVNEVDQEVRAAISCEEWRVEYMTLMMEYKERYNEGIEQGIKVFILDKIEDSVPREKVVEKLQKGFGISEGKAESYYDEVLDEMQA